MHWNLERMKCFVDSNHKSLLHICVIGPGPGETINDNKTPERVLRKTIYYTVTIQYLSLYESINSNIRTKKKKFIGG